ncbi:MAG TPA: hypothetical protein VFF30_07810 [Nitrososphaerales archaeon]|nr:hypothetical protein [Nitrososphaerales archaeon]
MSKIKDIRAVSNVGFVVIVAILMITTASRDVEEELNRKTRYPPLSFFRVRTDV